MHARLVSLFLLGLASGCASDSDVAEPNKGAVVSNGSGSGGDASTTTASGGGKTGGAGGKTGGAGGKTGVPEVLRFVAMGDGGTGSGTQLQVAQAVKAECDSRGGCEFALYLGDNIYDSGADSVDDDQFRTKFEVPYAGIDFPFYITLGNHDYGGNGIGFEMFKGKVQVDYSQQSAKWVLPDFYWDKLETRGSTTAHFFSLDTNSVMFSQAEEQQAWLSGALANSNANWKIAFGHHTYVSNGKHGNAGTYEGNSLVPIVSGKAVKTFFDDTVCGAVDVYICGHDHNRQWLEPTCGTEFIVSGSAAKTSDLKGRGTATFFETDELAGFTIIEIQGDTLTGWMYDENGDEEFTRRISK